MADRKRSPKFTSPRGRLGWPKLTEPDYGTKDYPKPDGEYSTKLILVASDPATVAFIAALRPHYDAMVENAEAAFKALKPETRKKLKAVSLNPLFTELLDKDTEEPTGEIEFKFAMKASGEYKKGPKAGQRWKAVCPIFDRKGVRLPKPPAIWGGTEAKVSFTLAQDKDGNFGYFIPGTGAAGLKLSLEAVQVLKLSSGNDRSAGSYGFGGDEDGDDIESRDDEDADGEGSGDNGGDAEETPDF